MRDSFSGRYHAFLQSLMFYTRIPVPTGAHHSEELMREATVWLPVVGWIVGGVCAMAAWGALHLWGVGVSVLVSTVVGLFLTGAIHEDGLADVCDGFGGGFTMERTLQIMKDSSVGVFGALGVVIALLLKVSLLSDIIGHPVQRFRWGQTLLVLPVAHAISRAAAVSLMGTHQYVGGHSSKAQPMTQRLSPVPMAVVVATGVLPLVAFAVSWWTMAVVPAVVVTWFMMGRWMGKRIGGYTGDCLGAIQQVTELVVYFTVAAVWRWHG